MFGVLVGRRDTGVPFSAFRPSSHQQSCHTYPVQRLLTNMFRLAVFLFLFCNGVNCIEETDVDRKLQKVCGSSSQALSSFCPIDVEADVRNYNCGDLTSTKQCFIDYQWLSTRTAYTTCCRGGGGKVYSYSRSCQIFNSQVDAFVDHRTENIPLCLGSSCDETDAISTLQAVMEFHPHGCELLQVVDPLGTTVFSRSAAPGNMAASVAFALIATLFSLLL